ncbi:ATP-binding protein [Vibrio splendidus]|uniref:ATP-binding protein n=1 Tax=Vibrio splendidus TaxID=29497 RepID=UPI0024690B1E|nr:ATP-binding protein [Vibrio splendidus]MDH5912750.1 ATP-binding protein [Vibrio splendidus]MDH5941468.1 ATP-binding protein [Vibrio splendidus]MDH5986673.1 ATP-binding protein [Vibrio splendidus]MDH5992874.1 ATP-binding protein [Vibrio splendidus]MDH6006350.1 ATP-binding protein [Vibrio splendidus]
MNQYAVICLDNNPVSIERIRSELAPLASVFDIYTAENIEDAHHALEDIHDHHQTVALVITHHHSGFNGVQFLIELEQLPHSNTSRTILVSASSDIQSILTAVNEGRLNHCLTKPVQDQVLFKSAQKELTSFVIQYDSENLLSYSDALDQQRLFRAHIEQKIHSFQSGFIHDYHQLSDNALAERVVSALQDVFSKDDKTKAIRDYSPEHLLTVEGEDNRFLWLIIEGEAALYKKDELGQQREVVRHSKGNIVGGMSFVTGEPSFSTAITLTQTRVIKLDKDSFAQVMHSNNTLLPLFTNLLLRHFNRRLQRSITNKIKLQQTLESLESAHQQLIEKEKMAMLGQLVAGVAHELNNPIAAILRSIETLSEHLDQILENSSFPESNKGTDVLAHSKLAKPLSTAQERQLVKHLTSTIDDRALAKKAVRLNLSQDSAVLDTLKDSPVAGKELLNDLEHYYYVGNSIRSIQVCSKRIADMVKSLKSYAREDEEVRHYTDIHEGVEDTLVIFENRLKHHQLEKHYDTELPPLLCQSLSLQQVWTNLISNALDALSERGKVSITTSQQTQGDDTFLVVEISDTGHGITKEDISTIFNPNFTTKKEGNFGLGIGLSISQQIVSAHQGFILVESEVGSHTHMQVWLPFKQEGAPHE